MSNPTPPIFPVPPGDSEDPVTTEVDGEKTLDPDVDPGQIDSAEADRIASTDGEDHS